MFTKLWRHWLARSWASADNRSRRHLGAKPNPRRTYRLVLETLEDRTAPAVLIVNTLMDTSGGNDLSLRDAIAAVNAGPSNQLTVGEATQVSGTFGPNDTIVFAFGLSGRGTIALSSSLPQIRANVQILGPPGSSQLTIDGTKAFQIFDISPSVGQVSITGLTLAHGLAVNGGAIQAGVNNDSNSPQSDNTNLSVSNCTFSGNQASDAFFGGGAVSIFSGNLALAHCVFTDNSALNGGAVNNDDGTMELNYDSFSANKASGKGAAIYTDGASLTVVQNSVFSGNTAVSNGGAVFSASGNLILTNDSFSGNSAVEGGAIQSSGRLTVTASTFAGNSATGFDGGAIEVFGPAFIVDSTFAGNSCGQNGGGVCLEVASASLVLTNDTLSGNTAGNIGGGFAVDSGAAGLDNTIVAGNTTSLNGNRAINDIGGTVFGGSYNLIDDPGSAGGLNGSNGNLLGVAAELLPLGNYGGPTQTMPPAPGSPALEAGTVNYLTSGETDQRGFSRTSGGTVDIGAVEIQPAGAGTHLELQGPGSVYLGSVMSWTATVLDDNNVPAMNFSGPVTMSVATGPASFTSSSTTVASAVYGTAAFNNLTLETPGYYSVQASFGNSSVSAPLVVTGQLYLAFLKQPVASVTAGTSLGSVQVAIDDLSGNPVSGDNDPITLTLLDTANGVAFPAPFGDGQDTETVPAQNGIATFTNLVVDAVATGGTPSSYILVASAGDLGTPGSSSFVVHPAAPNQLVFVQQPGPTVDAGMPIMPDPIVAVEDQFGNVVSNNTSRVSLTAVGPGSLTGNTIKSVSLGQAAFNNLGLEKNGSYTLTATDGGLPPATSNTFTVIMGDPVVGPSQSAVVDKKYAAPLYAKVTDASGINPLAGVAVTFTAPATGPGGRFAGRRTVTVRTNAAGIATAPAFTANTKAGHFVVTVGFGGLAAPETIALINLAGPPAHVLTISGTPQSAATNSSFAKPLTVEVKDAFGNVLSSVPVHFRVEPGSDKASATFAGSTAVTATTTNTGLATAPVLQANGVRGAFKVKARVAENGVFLAATFDLTNL